MKKSTDKDLTNFSDPDLDISTTNFLNKSTRQIMDVVSNNATQIGEILYKAQQRLAGFNNNGAFAKWIEYIGFSRQSAYNYINRYIAVQKLDSDKEIQAFEALPKTLTYDISRPSATEEARQAALNGDIKTHKEYKALEAKLKQREQELADRDETIANQQAELEDNRKTQLELNKRNAELSKQQPEPKVITKTVTKEVKPADYDQIKERLADLEKRAKKDQEDIEYYQRELQASENRRKQSESDDHLKELELKRKKRDAQIDAYSVSLKIADFLPELQKITQDDIDRMGDEAKHNLRTRIDMIRQIIDNIDAMFDGPRVIEGDFTNDN